jgi:hypothetical protein
VNSSIPPSIQEQAMIDLSRWISRALQYSPHHPLSAQLAAQTHATLTRALRERTPLEVGILRDKLMIGSTQARHPALTTRLAPYLHERGALVLRFIEGVTVDELSSLVDVLSRPAAETFSAGGLRALLTDRHVAHVGIDEIAHELTVEDRERIRKEEQVRELFREMLMRLLSNGEVPPDIGAHIAELADHPDLAVRVIQSEPHVNLAEAVAAFTMILMQEEQRRGEALLEKMGPILMQLAPESRDRVLLGLPPLVGDFRQALSSAFGVLSEPELARFVFSSVRSHATDLEPTLYAFEVAAAEDGRRIETGRRLAGLLYDLSLDEVSTPEILHALAAQEKEAPSFAGERAALAEAALRILETRAPLHRRGEDELMDAHAFAPGALERLAMQAARDIVVRSARMVDFDKFCERLPSAARSLSDETHAPAIAGILLGLASVTQPPWAELVDKTLTRITRSGVSALAIRAAEKLAGRGEDAQVDDVLVLARLVCAHNPEPVLDLLERADSRKMRRALIDIITAAGPELLSSVQTRLQSSQWFVTRNMVILHVRLGGDARELRPLADHPHAQVRIEVVRQLRSLARDPTACEIVAGRLADPTPEVVQAAIASLATMELPPAAVGALETVATDEQRGEEARRAAVQVLGRCRSEVAPDALVRLLQPHGLIERPSTTAIREEAARALRGCPAPNAQARFEEALRSSAWRVRKACERAMGQEQGGG